MLHTSGDEVGATAAGGIADTASPLVRELLARTGIRVATGAHLPDTADAVRDAVGPDRMPGELVVIIGATGRGTADHLRAALDAVGAVILVDGLPIRPGGSLIVAALPDGGTLLGLGGNPVAALAGAALCAPPLRDALLAAAPAPADEIAVDNAAELAHPTLWRVVPIRPQGAGRWLGAAVTSTAEPGSLIGARGIALLAPQAGGPVRRLI